MSESMPREYTIRVQQTILFFEDVVVTAVTEEEARALAVEEFQCDWSKSIELETTTHSADGGMKALKSDRVDASRDVHRRHLPRLIEDSRTALNQYIGDDPLDLHDAAREMYRVLRAFVSWTDEFLCAYGGEEP